MMYKTEKGTLGGREVELRNIGCGDFDEVFETKENKGDKVMLKLICALSAHWVDTGERVFPDVAAVDAWPMRDIRERNDLIAKAVKVNSPSDAPTDVTVQNGADKGDTIHYPH